MCIVPSAALMTLKVIIALLLIAVPMCAQAQNPRVTKDNAQKVVTIISGDKAKTQTYCEIQKLTQQMEQAYEKNDSKTVDQLSEKIDTLEDTLGPEYAELINGLQDIDPEKDKLGAEIMSMFEALDGLCAR
jgi:mevalonate kinase